MPCPQSNFVAIRIHVGTVILSTNASSGLWFSLVHPRPSSSCTLVVELFRHLDTSSKPRSNKGPPATANTSYTLGKAQKVPVMQHPFNYNYSKVQPDRMCVLCYRPSSAVLGEQPMKSNQIIPDSEDTREENEAPKTTSASLCCVQIVKGTGCSTSSPSSSSSSPPFRGDWHRHCNTPKPNVLWSKEQRASAYRSGLKSTRKRAESMRRNSRRPNPAKIRRAQPPDRVGCHRSRRALSFNEV